MVDIAIPIALYIYFFKCRTLFVMKASDHLLWKTSVHTNDSVDLHSTLNVHSLQMFCFMACQLYLTAGARKAIEIRAPVLQRPFRRAQNTRGRAGMVENGSSFAICTTQHPMTYSNVTSIGMETYYLKVKIIIWWRSTPTRFGIWIFCCMNF